MVVVVEVLVPGDEPVVVEVLDDEDDEPPDGDDLSITVVLLSLFFSPGGLVTVVSFCSQAARKAMLIKIQMYFIILQNRNNGPNCASTDWLMESYLWSYRSSRGWLLWSLWSCLTDWWPDLLPGPQFQFFAHMTPAARRQLEYR